MNRIRIERTLVATAALLCAVSIPAGAADIAAAEPSALSAQARTIRLPTQTAGGLQNGSVIFITERGSSSVPAAADGSPPLQPIAKSKFPAFCNIN